MPDLILFDLFGVIARLQSPAGQRTLAGIAGSPPPAFRDAYWKLRAPYDRGDVTAAQYWQRVATELGTDFVPEQITALVAADIASCNAVDDEMVTLIEQSAISGVRMALLSNIPEDLAADYEKHHHRWLRHFELIAFSCRIGHAKPDPAAFLWCCRRLDLAPDRILFIDDSAENLDSAQRLGLHTHLFTGPATVPLPPATTAPGPAAT
jgi:putative hydrolase of the HAD superfamily